MALTSKGRIYNLEEGSIQQQFNLSRHKVQGFGGGFGNGKSAALCIKALGIAKDYPGSNILLGRSTYPKLNDTLRKEFLKWCPPEWIKSFPRSANASNTCTLTNGTEINFRYVSQKGKSSDQGATSNLLSATYDFIGLDQLEDPEIVEKDFDDLLGRLRGSTPYVGDDPSMPRSGPRWFCFTLNPTRGWPYRRLVKPYHAYKKTGQITEGLLYDKRNGQVMIHVVEGSTYTNQNNLPPDFIQLLETTYQGQMRDRFLMGKWVAYEGLVYPSFDMDHHVIPHELVEDYWRQLQAQRIEPIILEGYDFGMASPSCYLFGFADDKGNVIICDGFYKAEYRLPLQWEEIRNIRHDWGIMKSRRAVDFNPIYADPDIFKRKGVDKDTVGVSVASMFMDDGPEGGGIEVTPGNNDINAGVTKINSYLHVQKWHRNPFTGELGAPCIYFSSKVSFLIDEITDYYWQKNQQDEATDKPMDRRDHAMDSMKYLMSPQVEIAEVVALERFRASMHITHWSEKQDDQEPDKRLRTRRIA